MLVLSNLACTVAPKMTRGQSHHISPWRKKYPPTYYCLIPRPARGGAWEWGYNPPSIAVSVDFSCCHEYVLCIPLLPPSPPPDYHTCHTYFVPLLSVVHVYCFKKHNIQHFQSSIKLPSYPGWLYLKTRLSGQAITDFSVWVISGHLKLEHLCTLVQHLPAVEDVGIAAPVLIALACQHIIQ